MAPETVTFPRMIVNLPRRPGDEAGVCSVQGDIDSVAKPCSGGHPPSSSPPLPGPRAASSPLGSAGSALLLAALLPSCPSSTCGENSPFCSESVLQQATTPQKLPRAPIPATFPRRGKQFDSKGTERPRSTSESCKINKSWGCNVLHGDYS